MVSDGVVNRSFLRFEISKKFEANIFGANPLSRDYDKKKRHHVVSNGHPDKSVVYVLPPSRFNLHPGSIICPELVYILDGVHLGN